MTDLASLVSYEREFPLALTHPATGKPIGVTFWVKHVDCEAATEVARKQGAAAVLGNASDDDSRALYAACISRWDWGDNTFNGEPVGDYTHEAAVKVLSDPGAKWMLLQVVKATTKIGNFTNA